MDIKTKRRNQYRGIADCNAILRGETNVKPGDTFIVEPNGHTALWVAFRFTPKHPEPEKAYLHFRTLEVGARAKVEAAAKNHIK